MRTYEEKARLFWQLHERPGIFVIPNPWDAGTARALASLGFEALATTSLGLANVLGLRDGANIVSREEVLTNCRVVASATDLPVHADLENGYAVEPRAVAEMIRLAAETGVVAGSIEDATGDPRMPIYDFNLSVGRVHAAVEMAHALPGPFMLTARAENFLRGPRDLEDTIRRLQAYERAGADVLYAGATPNLAAIRAMTAALTKPLNVGLGGIDASITVAALAEAGVKRVSTGGSMTRVAFTAILGAARELKETGTATYLRDLAPSSALWEAFEAHTPRAMSRQ
jgi:2-methylisocitrate lyase-like PEP mutase family enzyme